MIKRVFDFVVALGGLVCLSPMFLVVAILVKLSSPGPVIFRQVRVGRGFQPFHIYKFRTMVKDAPNRGPTVTAGPDGRITRVGSILRRTKIDELPQLLNVLKGDMSLVGPRPEVPKYVELFRSEFEKVLTVRPGVTDLASVKYHNEQAYLGRFDNPEEEYVRSILPEKIELAREYIRRSSFLFDVGLIVQTVWSVGVSVAPRVPSADSPLRPVKPPRKFAGAAADESDKCGEQERL
jgi:lipopolysaccharide/colanic/teichoic acid biosynthesis glycosyltransferase